MKKALLLGALVVGIGIVSDAVAMSPTTTPATAAAVRHTTKTVHRKKPLSERIEHKKEVIKQWQTVESALSKAGFTKDDPAYRRVHMALARNESGLKKMQKRQGFWGGVFGDKESKSTRTTTTHKTTTRTPARTARGKRSTARALAVKKAAEHSRERDAARAAAAQRTARSSKTIATTKSASAQSTKKAAEGKSFGEKIREALGMEKAK